MHNDHSHEHDHSHDDHDHDHDHEDRGPLPGGSAADGWVTDQCVVALTWTLKDGSQEVLDELEEPVEFLVGGDDLLLKIEQAIVGHRVGETVHVQVEPHEGFGDYNENLVFVEPRSAFPSDLEPGMMFEGLPPGCSEDAPKDIFYTVEDIYPEHVMLDGNHPLAGMALRLRLRIEATRPANIEEVGRGSCGVGFFKAVPQAPSSDTIH
jgi:FKBP-type peptidyl-prolyl cis-trans isomerase SlyD